MKQVQEYDKKKAENPEFIQLSILVSSEQDGVLWLKNLLTDKSLNLSGYTTPLDASLGWCS